MAAVKTEFTEFIAEDIRKYEGIWMPLKSGIIRRTLVRWAKCKNMHPNPGDEFCFPDIGPNYTIISDYEKQMRYAISHGYGPWEKLKDRIMVERMYPEGYMIINGHHRWAAALRVGLKRAPIKILNLVHEDDIVNIIEKSVNNKRVTIDLNELVFVNEAEHPVEKKLPFPANMKYKETIRLGFPALCRFLQGRGYDVWVFTSNICSVDYIEALLSKHHIKPDGIITASGRIENTTEEKKKHVKEIINKKYVKTLNLYNDMVISIDSRSGDYDQIPLETSDHDWAAAVESAVRKLNDDDKEENK